MKSDLEMYLVNRIRNNKERIQEKHNDIRKIQEEIYVLNAEIEMSKWYLGPRQVDKQQIPIEMPLVQAGVER